MTSEIQNSNSSSNESVSSKDGQDHFYSSSLDALKKNSYQGDFYNDGDHFNRAGGGVGGGGGGGYGGEDCESYSTTSPVLYKSNPGGIPQKGLRNLGIHPLPIYRPQPNNV